MINTYLKRYSMVAAGTVLGFLISSVQEKAQALTFQTYTDLASWEAAVSGTTNLEDFNSQPRGLFSNPINVSGFNDFSITGHTAGDSIGVIAGTIFGNIDGTNWLGWAGLDAGPMFDFNLNQATNAFAFDWRDTDLTDSYEIKIAGTNFEAPPFSRDFSFNRRGFFGVVAVDGTFDKVSFSQTRRGGVITPFGVDNVRTVYAAPEPVTYILAPLLAGGFGIACYRQQKQKKQLKAVSKA